MAGHNSRGKNNPSWSGGRSQSSDGYTLVKMPDHPRAQHNGYVFEHLLLAEAALGKPLPPRAEVHHVRGKHDNRALVICEDRKYHQLLHQRQRALDACGNPNWRQCGYCSRYDDPTNLYINPHNCFHRDCKNTYRREREAA